MAPRLRDDAQRIGFGWCAARRYDSVKHQEEHMNAIEMVVLRWYDRARLRRIAAGGGPTLRGDNFHVWCPRCGCNKSGDIHDPNIKTEACSDPTCRCHDEP